MIGTAEEISRRALAELEARIDLRTGLTALWTWFRTAQPAAQAAE